MNIGIEAQRLFRPKKHGIEIVALELIRHLQEIDKENQYFIFVKPDLDDQCIRETENFKIIKLAGISYPSWEQWNLPKAIGKYRLDVLHCTANTAPLHPKVKTVITLHDVIFLESVSFKGTAYQNIGNLYRRFIVPKVAKKNFLVTVSEFERKNIMETLGIPPAQIEVVYNAVNPMFRVIDDPVILDAAKLKYGLPDQFILFFANPAPKKNTPNVLAAFAHYCRNYGNNSVKLLVTDSSLQYIQWLIQSLGLEDIADRIQIIDYINYNDLPSVYNLAKLFLYPSFRESFGLPILEAMACGTPVISSNSSAMPEIAGNAALLTDPHNVREIGDTIAKLLQNEITRQALRSNGLENVKRFSWDKTARKMLGIYQRLAKEK
jgi:glycosyltransferase involved in cell wall biosynthesis